MTFPLPHPRSLFPALAAALLAILGVLALTGGSEIADRSQRTLAAAGIPVPAPGAPAVDRVRALERQLELVPSAAGYAGLAGAHLQAARETEDGSHYALADAAVRRALNLDPGDAGALVEASAVAAARHHFPEALEFARRARAAAPDAARPLGVEVDALVELGRIPAAERALQRMIDLQPSSGAYARASYLRELRGDLPGALEAMRLAASAGGEAPEHAASLHALLGNLELRAGDVDAARQEFLVARNRFPGLGEAELGLARADAAEGDLASARRRLVPLLERLPAADHAVALGEVELASGREAEARRAFAIARAEGAKLLESGERAEAELAIFEADHGSAREAVELARRGVAARAGLRAPDALAWALTRAGEPREALPWAERALALAPADPLTNYHAGIAAADAGRPALAARRLRTALRAPAVLGPVHAEAARRALAGVR